MAPPHDVAENREGSGQVSSRSVRARVVAFYLPQFHPIPENDRFWGPGFTEWTNVAKARPLFRGHEQPHLPGELGFYDLRLAESREAQASLAREHGVEAFCYWYYWFSGRKVLERPFTEVLTSGRPEFPFCVGWANHSWTGVWIGAPDKALIEQQYPGEEDHAALFRDLLPAFRDPRYLRVDSRPLFVVFRPRDLPSPRSFSTLWRRLAREAGLPGIHLVGVGCSADEIPALGFDAVVGNWVPERYQSIWRRLLRRLLPGLRDRLTGVSTYSYEWYTNMLARTRPVRTNQGWDYPFVLPNWDNTPRAGRDGVVLTGSTPDLFRVQVANAIRSFDEQEIPVENRILFVKSWNEWAEGNYLEPDRRRGRAFLEALRDQVRGAQRSKTA